MGGILVASMFSSICLAQFSRLHFSGGRSRLPAFPAMEQNVQRPACTPVLAKSWACSCQVLKTVNSAKRLSRASDSALKSFQLGWG